jgi:Carboxypeptidase regulatory-like domain
MRAASIVLGLVLLLPGTSLRAQAGDSTVLSRFCADSARRVGQGALVGRVRSAEDGAPLAGVAVVLRWDELGVERATGQATITPHTQAAVTDDQARYRFCAVPRYTPLLLQAQAADRRSGAVEVRLGDEPVFVRGLTLSLAAQTDSGARGTATLIGEVVTSVGQPVRGARANVDGAAGEAVSNDTGVFVLPQLPAGTQTLIVRAIGYLPKRLSVELRANSSGAATVVLDQTVRMLDSVRVLARRYATRQAFQAAFEQRQRASPGGSFLDEERIGAHVYANTADIFRTIRGLTVSPDGIVSVSRGAGSLTDALCVPMLILDGVQMQTTLDIVRPQEIRAIEVYRGSETPVQYNDPCGAILIWTK